MPCIHSIRFLCQVLHYTRLCGNYPINTRCGCGESRLVARAQECATDQWPVTSTLVQHTTRFELATSVVIRSTCIHSCINWLIHPCIHSLMHSFIRSFMHAFIRAFMHWFIHWFMHSFIHAFTPSLMHFMHSLIPSLMQCICLDTCIRNRLRATKQSINTCSFFFLYLGVFGGIPLVLWPRPLTIATVAMSWRWPVA